MPSRTEALGKTPMLRYVGHPEIDRDQAAIAAWADHVTRWISEGRTPYVFMHQAPDDVLAPQLCRLFHEELRTRLPHLEPLPEFPGESEARQRPPKPIQLELF
jgi:uncharacterized protein YecE (DUF72 family)